MNIVGQDKPSLEDALKHYGVLGMKWGRTRVKGTSADVRDAREAIQVKSDRIDRQRENVVVAKRGSTERNKETAKLAKMVKDYNNDPDRVLAARMTRGEKAIIGILSIPTLGIPYVAAVATSSGVSRRIERKQETGAYTKKLNKELGQIAKEDTKIASRSKR